MSESNKSNEETKSDTDTLPKPKLQVHYFNYVFKIDFKLVLETLRNFEMSSKIINKFQPNHINDIKLTKGNFMWEKGAEFNYLYRNSMTLYLKVIDYQETDTFGYIKFHIYKTDPFTFDFFISNYFNKDCRNKYTSYILKWEFSDKIEIDVNKVNEERLFIYTGIEKYLINQKDEYEQTEKTYVQCDFKEVWEIVSNLKIMASKVPLICDEIESEDKITIGSELKLKWNQNEDNETNAYVKLRVKDIIINETYGGIFYDCVDGRPSIPNQQISWKVERVEGGFCLIYFTHIYSEKINYGTIKYIADAKKKILKNLRNVMEN